MSNEITITVEKEPYEQMLHFKKIWDTQHPEERSLNEYFNEIFCFGFEQMVKEYLPPNMDVMQHVMLELFREDPERFTSFIKDMLSGSKNKMELEKKEGLKKIREGLTYIQ